MIAQTTPLHTEAKVRAAGVAGAFYPADARQLTALMDAMLTEAAPPHIEGSILAAVAPHAGFVYSGPVAAWTFAALRERTYARVVVIAPSHFEAFSFTSVYSGDAYATPLGALRVDKAFATELATKDASIRLAEEGHAPTARGSEHALEVQLPWLQHVLGEVQIVPIVMGEQSYTNCRALGVALAKMIASGAFPGETLILASSDLSHYHAYDEAAAMDRKTLGALAAWDYFGMMRNFATRHWEACGGAPVVAAMMAAERLGARRAEVLRYANSGDVTGDRSRVVGYGAAVLAQLSNKARAEIPFSLSAEEKRELLDLAKRSVEHAVREQKVLEAPRSAHAALCEERGAFVTLKKGGNLRGCIGYISTTKPLVETVRDTATMAALRDPRFAPVSIAELPELHYEISVLSPMRRVTEIERIHVGEHGLLVKRGDREGLLLPQVPLEWHWDRKTFLEQTCNKAGLPRESWQSDETDIFAFTAVIFAED